MGVLIVGYSCDVEHEELIWGDVGGDASDVYRATLVPQAIGQAANRSLPNQLRGGESRRGYNKGTTGD